jgi:hypothetical protein
MTSGGVRRVARQGRRGASPRASLRAHSASVAHVSPLKKLLMTFMVLGTMGTTVGAGTFASFTANTTNGASFETGTLELTNQAPTGSLCYSTGGGDTDSNSNDSCTPMFTSTNASIKRPGDVAEAELTLSNAGSLSGALAGYMTNAANCVDSDVTGANYKGDGTVSTCQNVQLAVQEYTDALRGTPSVCRYGNGATGVLTGTTVTLPLNISASNNRFRLQVNGTTFATDAAIAAGSYTTISSLASAVQTAARAVTGGAGVIVAGTTSNTLQITNPTPLSGTNNIGMATPSGSSALTSLGLTSLTAATGGQASCTLNSASPDHTHTLANFLAEYPTSASALPLSTLTPNQTRWYKLSLMLPPGADNQLQGRKVTFSISWSLTQS